MSKTMLKGILRRALGVTRHDEVLAPKGFAAGGDGQPTIVLPSHNTTAFFDDFLGVISPDTGGVYYNLKGADTGGDNALTLLSGGPGALRMISPQNTAPSVGGGFLDVQGLIAGRNFDAGQGRVRFAARIRTVDTGTTPNGNIVFAGFTDDTGTIEVPMWVDTGEDNSNANGEISALATNAFGWLFDTATDTGNGCTATRWQGVAVAGGTVASTLVQGSNTVLSNVWDVVECELDRNVGDTGGTAHFWLNGIKVGTISGPAVASTAKLNPVIATAGHHTSTGNTNKVDVDYWAFSAARDTGD